MGVSSGKFGAINQFDFIRNWILSETTTPAEFRASNTLGGTGRSEGVYDYSGSCEGFGGVPPVMPGEYFDFAGFTAPDDGSFSGTGETRSALNAICNEVTINWNWETGEILNWSMSFAAGEPLTITHANAIVTDASIPVPKVICGTKVTLTVGDTVWDNIVSASLTISANNPTFVNSSTGGATGRRRGIIDWTASVVEQATEQNLTLIPSTCLVTRPGGDNILKLWVDPLDYWELQFAHYVDATDLRVDNDTGDIIGQTNNFAQAAVSGGVVGFIARPGENGTSPPYWWPETINAQINPF